MSDDTYDVTVPIDRRVVDRTQQLEALGHGDLEALFDDIASVLAFYQRVDRATVTDVRGSVDFDHEVSHGLEDLMDTCLLDLLAELGYLKKTGSDYAYNV